MNWVDGLAILVVATAAVWGGMRGFLTAGLTVLGGAVGAVFGLFMGPKLAQLTQAPEVRGAMGIAVLIGLISAGMAVGAAVGHRGTRVISVSGGMVANQILGSIVSPLLAAMVLYLVAVPLASVRYTWLAGAVRSSATIQVLDKMAPQQVRSWPAALGQLFNDSGFPQILDPLGRTPVAQVPEPDPLLAGLPAVRTATQSVVKVLALAPNCPTNKAGTGFVVGPNYVLTNAHVVAGSSEVRVQVGNRQVPGVVVGYDAQLDVAMVRTKDLGLPVLKLNTTALGIGFSVIVAGFPLDQGLTVVSGRVQSSFELDGPDIYRTGDVQRQVYVLKALIREGNSGGPVLAPDGSVVGVVFASAPDVAETGYALTAAQVSGFVQTHLGATAQVSTAACLVSQSGRT